MKISEQLWEARFALEERRRPKDPSTVFLGELANVLEEYGVTDLIRLRVMLEDAWENQIFEFAVPGEKEE